MSGTLPLQALHYHYPGFSTAAVTALNHFKELTPARYPFSLTCVQCGDCRFMSCQMTLVLRQGFEPHTFWFRVRRLIHWTYIMMRGLWILLFDLCWPKATGMSFLMLFIVSKCLPFCKKKSLISKIHRL